MIAVSNDDLSLPFAEWQEVDVTFSSTANADTVITHSLAPSNPEQIRYIPLRRAQGDVVYHDTAFNRKKWQKGFIVLRSTIANAKVTLLLYVPHITTAPTF